MYLKQDRKLLIWLEKNKKNRSLFERFFLWHQPL